MEVVKVLSYIREEERSAIAKGRTRSFCSSLAPLTFTGITFCSHTTLAGYPYSNHSSENCLYNSPLAPRSCFRFFFLSHRPLHLYDSATPRTTLSVTEKCDELPLRSSEFPRCLLSKPEEQNPFPSLLSLPSLPSLPSKLSSKMMETLSTRAERLSVQTSIKRIFYLGALLGLISLVGVCVVLLRSSPFLFFTTTRNS